MGMGYRVIIALGGIGGVSWLNYLIAQEFGGVTVALFLILSLFIVAGLTTNAMNPERYNRPVGQPESKDPANGRPKDMDFPSGR